MALVENLLKGWGGMLVGFGAGIAAPTLFPDAGSKVRPIASAFWAYSSVSPVSFT